MMSCNSYRKYTTLRLAFKAVFRMDIQLNTERRHKFGQMLKEGRGATGKNLSCNIHVILLELATRRHIRHVCMEPGLAVLRSSHSAQCKHFL